MSRQVGRGGGFSGGVEGEGEGEGGREEFDDVFSGRDAKLQHVGESRRRECNTDGKARSLQKQRAKRPPLPEVSEKIDDLSLGLRSRCGWNSLSCQQQWAAAPYVFSLEDLQRLVYEYIMRTSFSTSPAARIPIMHGINSRVESRVE